MANETMTRQQIEATMTQEQFDAALLAKVRAGVLPLADQLAQLAEFVGTLAQEIDMLRARVAKLEGPPPRPAPWPSA
jgi:cell division protein FtsB